jgi:hypothetical protein
MSAISLGKENSDIEFKFNKDIFPKQISCIFEIKNIPLKEMPNISISHNGKIEQYKFEIEENSSAGISIKYISALYKSNNKIVTFDDLLQSEKFNINKKIITGFTKKFECIEENISIRIKDTLEGITYVNQNQEFEKSPYFPCGGVFHKNPNQCGQIYMIVDHESGIIKLKHNQIDYQNEELTQFIKSDDEKTLTEYINNRNLKFDMNYDSKESVINIVTGEEKLPMYAFCTYSSFHCTLIESNRIKIDFEQCDVNNVSEVNE